MAGLANGHPSISDALVTSSLVDALVSLLPSEAVLTKIKDSIRPANAPKVWRRTYGSGVLVFDQDELTVSLRAPPCLLVGDDAFTLQRAMLERGVVCLAYKQLLKYEGTPALHELHASIAYPPGLGHLVATSANDSASAQLRPGFHLVVLLDEKGVFATRGALPDAVSHILGSYYQADGQEQAIVFADTGEQEQQDMFTAPNSPWTRPRTGARAHPRGQRPAVFVYASPAWANMRLVPPTAPGAGPGPGVCQAHTRLVEEYVASASLPAALPINPEYAVGIGGSNSLLDTPSDLENTPLEALLNTHLCVGSPPTVGDSPQGSLLADGGVVSTPASHGLAAFGLSHIIAQVEAAGGVLFDPAATAAFRTALQTDEDSLALAVRNGSVPAESAAAASARRALEAIRKRHLSPFRPPMSASEAAAGMRPTGFATVTIRSAGKPGASPTPSPVALPAHGPGSMLPLLGFDDSVEAGETCSEVGTRSPWLVTSALVFRSVARPPRPEEEAAAVAGASYLHADGSASFNAGGYFSDDDDEAGAALAQEDDAFVSGGGAGSGTGRDRHLGAGGSSAPALQDCQALETFARAALSKGNLAQATCRSHLLSLLPEVGAPETQLEADRAGLPGAGSSASDRPAGTPTWSELARLRWLRTLASLDSSAFFSQCNMTSLLHGDKGALGHRHGSPLHRLRLIRRHAQRALTAVRVAKARQTARGLMADVLWSSLGVAPGTGGASFDAGAARWGIHGACTARTLHTAETATRMIASAGPRVVSAGPDSLSFLTTRAQEATDAGWLAGVDYGRALQVGQAAATGLASALAAVEVAVNRTLEGIAHAVLASHRAATASLSASSVVSKATSAAAKAEEPLVTSSRGALIVSAGKMMTAAASAAAKAVSLLATGGVSTDEVAPFLARHFSTRARQGATTLAVTPTRAGFLPCSNWTVLNSSAHALISGSAAGGSSSASRRAAAIANLPGVDLSKLPAFGGGRGRIGPSAPGSSAPAATSASSVMVTASEVVNWSTAVAQETILPPAATKGHAFTYRGLLLLARHPEVASVLADVAREVISATLDMCVEELLPHKSAIFDSKATTDERADTPHADGAGEAHYHAHAAISGHHNGHRHDEAAVRALMSKNAVGLSNRGIGKFSGVHDISGGDANPSIFADELLDVLAQDVLPPSWDVPVPGEHYRSWTVTVPPAAPELTVPTAGAGALRKAARVIGDSLNYSRPLSSLGPLLEHTDLEMVLILGRMQECRWLASYGTMAALSMLPVPGYIEDYASLPLDALLPAAMKEGKPQQQGAEQPQRTAGAGRPTDVDLSGSDAFVSLAGGDLMDAPAFAAPTEPVAPAATAVSSSDAQNSVALPEEADARELAVEDLDRDGFIAPGGSLDAGDAAALAAAAKKAAATGTTTGASVGSPDLAVELGDFEFGGEEAAPAPKKATAAPTAAAKTTAAAAASFDDDEDEDDDDDGEWVWIDEATGAEIPPARPTAAPAVSLMDFEEEAEGGASQPQQQQQQQQQQPVKQQQPPPRVANAPPPVKVSAPAVAVELDDGDLVAPGQGAAPAAASSSQAGARQGAAPPAAAAAARAASPATGGAAPAAPTGSGVAVAIDEALVAELMEAAADADLAARNPGLATNIAGLLKKVREMTARTYDERQAVMIKRKLLRDVERAITMAGRTLPDPSSLSADTLAIRQKRQSKMKAMGSMARAQLEAHMAAEAAAPVAGAAGSGSASAVALDDDDAIAPGAGGGAPPAGSRPTQRAMPPLPPDLQLPVGGIPGGLPGIGIPGGLPGMTVPVPGLHGLPGMAMPPAAAPPQQQQRAAEPAVGALPEDDLSPGDAAPPAAAANAGTGRPSVQLLHAAIAGFADADAGGLQLRFVKKDKEVHAAGGVAEVTGAPAAQQSVTGDRQPPPPVAVTVTVPIGPDADMQPTVASSGGSDATEDPLAAALARRAAAALEKFRARMSATVAPPPPVEQQQQPADGVLPGASAESGGASSTASASPTAASQQQQQVPADASSSPSASPAPASDLHETILSRLAAVAASQESLTTADIASDAHKAMVCRLLLDVQMALIGVEAGGINMKQAKAYVSHVALVSRLMRAFRQPNSDLYLRTVITAPTITQVLPFLSLQSDVYVPVDSLWPRYQDTADTWLSTLGPMLLEGAILDDLFRRNLDRLLGDLLDYGTGLPGPSTGKPQPGVGAYRYAVPAPGVNEDAWALRYGVSLAGSPTSLERLSALIGDGITTEATSRVHLDYPTDSVASKVLLTRIAALPLPGPLMYAEWFFAISYAAPRMERRLKAAINFGWRQRLADRGAHAPWNPFVGTPYPDTDTAEAAVSQEGRTFLRIRGSEPLPSPAPHYRAPGIVSRYFKFPEPWYNASQVLTDAADAGVQAALGGSFPQLLPPGSSGADASGSGWSLPVPLMVSASRSGPWVSPSDAHPRVLVISAQWFVGHSVHRNFQPYVRALMKAFPGRVGLLFLASPVVSPASVDMEGFAIVHTIEIASGVPASRVLDNIERWIESAWPAHIIFYPSVGMHLADTLLTNRRLAPIQIASYGHSSSTRGGLIDFWIGGWESEVGLALDLAARDVAGGSAGGGAPAAGGLEAAAVPVAFPPATARRYPLLLSCPATAANGTQSIGVTWSAWAAGTPAALAAAGGAGAQPTFTSPDAGVTDAMAGAPVPPLHLRPATTACDLVPANVALAAGAAPAGTAARTSVLGWYDGFTMAGAQPQRSWGTAAAAATPSSGPLTPGLAHASHLLPHALLAAQSRYSERLILIPGPGIIFMNLEDTFERPPSREDDPAEKGAAAGGEGASAKVPERSYLMRPRPRVAGPDGVLRPGGGHGAAQRKPGRGTPDDPIIIPLAWSSMKSNMPHLTRLASILEDAQRLHGERALAAHRAAVGRCAAALARYLAPGGAPAGEAAAAAACSSFLQTRGSNSSAAGLEGLPAALAALAAATGPALSMFPPPPARHLTFHVRVFTGLAQRDIYAAQALWNALHTTLRVDAHPPGALQIELVMVQYFEGYLGNLTLAHLSLDSYPFSGCNSMQDLLWAGVPVVSLVHAPWDEEDAAFPAARVAYSNDDAWGWLDADEGEDAAAGYGFSVPGAGRNRSSLTPAGVSVPPPPVGFGYVREVRDNRRLPVPVLWRSAIGATMLARLGLSSLVARDPGEYHRLAVELLVDYEAREALRDAILATPLAPLSEARAAAAGDSSGAGAAATAQLVTDQAAASYPVIFQRLYASLTAVAAAEGVESAWMAAQEGRLQLGPAA